MENQRKHEISEVLKQRMEERGLSQSAAAKAIGELSSTTINFIVNKAWVDDPKCVSEAKFNQVASWLRMNHGWKIVPQVGNYIKIMNIAANAKQHKDMRLVISHACGAGKGETLKAFESQTKNSFYVECRLFFTRKDFLQSIQKAMGVRPTQGTVSAIFTDVISELQRRKSPLLIVDEAELLSDGALPLINDIYNAMRGNCGFIIAGTTYLWERIEKGVKKNKQGFNNLHSRVGGHPYKIGTASAGDIELVCRENGLTDQMDINSVINQAAGDLRQVEILVKDALFKQQKRRA